MSVDAAAVPPRATAREWTGLAVIALPCMLYSMDLTVLNLAIPSISAQLKPSASQLLWIIDIYGFLVAGLLITMGTLGDRIGRRRLLLIGAAAFGVASVLAAFATSAAMLIVTRALLGIAGATLAPSTLSLIRNMFLDPAQRTAAIGVWISSYSAGAVIGPLLGGLLLQYFWWGSVFLIGVPVMVLLLLVGPVLLPEYRDPAAGRLDLRSAALSLAAVLTAIYGIKQLAEQGPSWVALLSVAAGALFGLAFLRRQRRLADPMIDLRLFRIPAFSVSLGAYTMGCFAMFGIFIFVAQYLQLVLGLSPLQAGLWTAPWAGAFIVGSLLTPLVLRRLAPAQAVSAGLAVSALGFAVLVGLDAAGNGLLLLVAGTVVMSLGLAPVFTLATDLVVGTAPPERAGAASAMSETGSEFGGALGIAILGSIGTAIYRSLMADALPGGLPADAAALEAARNTLGGATALAAEMSGAAGAALLDAGRIALLRGLQAAAAIGAVLLLAMAAVVLITLRRADAARLCADNPRP